MARTPKLTERYFAALARCNVRPASPAAKALACTLRRLVAAKELPEAIDTAALVPPTKRAFVRAVSGQNP